MHINFDQLIPICRWLKWNQRTGTPLSISEFQEGVIVMKLEKQGGLASAASLEEVKAIVDAHQPKYDHLWARFKEWVAKHKPQEDQVAVSRLKVKSIAQVASCQPAIVEQAMNDLEIMMCNLGLAVDGVLTQKGSARLIVCDEKGISSRPGCPKQCCTSRQNQ
jgi:hypothetical protein